MKPPIRILPLIVISQFFCTSLWFAGNGVMSDLVADFQLSGNALGHLSSAVQFGFISGTLVFALLTISDRIHPSRIFLISALIGAVINLGVIWDNNQFESLLAIRFATGFFLAGIYPVGMKIAADYYGKELGKSLGFLVGALVIGTAFPHLLKGITGRLPWRSVIIITSSLAVAGGLLMVFFVPEGPLRQQSQKLDPSAFLKVFRNKKFRSAAFGYFGHMWELYAFWAYVPVILKTYVSVHSGIVLNIPLLSFSIIAVGGLACVIGGLISIKLGAGKTAAYALLLSGICCLSSPLIFQVGSTAFLIGFLIIWGMAVIADSPMFSTLVAQNSNAASRGTALTIVNCIGFSITIISIQLLTFLQGLINPFFLYTLLATGPVLGLLALRNSNWGGGNRAQESRS